MCENNSKVVMHLELIKHSLNDFCCMVKWFFKMRPHRSDCLSCLAVGAVKSQVRLLDPAAANDLKTSEEQAELGEGRNKNPAQLVFFCTK